MYIERARTKLKHLERFTSHYGRVALEKKSNYLPFDDAWFYSFERILFIVERYILYLPYQPSNKNVTKERREGKGLFGLTAVAI